MAAKKTRKSSSGSTLTDEERAENGWAPRLTLRMTLEEAEIVDRIASPGEPRGITIRRLIRESVDK